MSDRIEIITNNQPREIIDACQLTPAQREQFDYLDWPAIEEGRDSASFFRYRGELYDLGEFMRCDSGQFPGWDGYASDSFFSGTLVRYPRENYGRGREEIDTESVIVARYYS